MAKTLGIEAAFQSIERLQKERDAKANELAKIDQTLAKIREVVNRSAIPNDGPRRKGTDILIEIVTRAGGRMQSKDLVAEATKRGVRHPHSAIQSIKDRRAKLEKGWIILK